MQTREIDYECRGVALKGYLADGSSEAPAPGVVVVHQGNGLSDHTRERAQMLAELGYVAFALDLYGERPTEEERFNALMDELEGDRARLHARAQAGLDTLKVEANVDLKRLAAIGHCFGGWAVLEMARACPELACVVAFHPGLANLPETDPRRVHAKVLVCAGVDDPLIPPEARERFVTLMNAARADWQLIVYGGAGHSFSDRNIDALGIPNFAYHALTDRRSWAAMCDLFDETFGAVAA
ncbi:MAG TPA: dienelactone hydrolase family protein [Caulobacteraceae bacterium]|nr:dienelactone hydrolase family protein [Caulobacteraceae bacterium]